MTAKSPTHDYHYEYDNRFTDKDIGLASGNANLLIGKRCSLPSGNTPVWNANLLIGTQINAAVRRQPMGGLKAQHLVAWGDPRQSSKSDGEEPREKGNPQTKPWSAVSATLELHKS